MPRIAIKDYNTSFFHIMVQGIRREYIFNEQTDIETYSRLIYKYMKKFNVKIIAYCIMNNHSHLLVYIDKIQNLSQFMKCVNTTYAMYYNKKYKKTGYVFRNRYKAEPIFDELYLNNCISYIHNNPLEAGICLSPEQYKFSSYREYTTNSGKIIKESKNIFPEINALFINNINNLNNNCHFIDYQEDKEFLDKEIVMKKFLKENSLKKDDIKNNIKYLKQIILKLKTECNLTHQEIANEFNISRIRVTRIINGK